MATKTIQRDVVIIGSGPAGLTAAIYTARANLKPLLIDAPADAEKQTTPGGQLMITTEVENYPGFSEGIQGPDLMVEFRKQAERFGTEFLETWIDSIDLEERPFTLYAGDLTIMAQTLVIATGASAKWLGIPGEAKVPQGFGGNGVSACATCDGPLPGFRDKPLVVIGGGDTAIEEATFLTRYASRVYVVHRRDKLRASKIMQDKAFRNEKIEFIWNTHVDEIIGTQEHGVTSVRLRDASTGQTREFPCSGVFVAIGHRPNTDLFQGPVGDGRDRLFEDFRIFNRYKYSRRLCLWRCAGFGLPAGSHCSRYRLYGCNRCGAVFGPSSSHDAKRRGSYHRRRTRDA